MPPKAHGASGRIVIARRIRKAQCHGACLIVHVVRFATYPRRSLALAGESISLLPSRIAVRAALCGPAYLWATIGRLLLAIEPLCLLRKHGPIPSHLLIRNLYEGISCLLRKLSRAIRFAPILICSKSHSPLTRVCRNYSPQQ